MHERPNGEPRAADARTPPLGSADDWLYKTSVHPTEAERASSPDAPLPSSRPPVKATRWLRARPK
jgi:hypothetical protein